MTEGWRDIPGYEGRYMVSDQGRVRSLIINDVMRQTLNKQTGYLQISLTGVTGKRAVYGVHQLVLLAFVGPRLTGYQTRHLDSIRSNNCLSNLCYGTPKENQADRERHGTAPHGEKNPSAKLSAEIVAYIRAQPRMRGTGVKLAEQFGVSETQIAAIVRNKSWVN
jgi:hypothetical protein